MKVLELFAGTGSIRKAFEARGHEVFSIDWDESFEGIDAHMDIEDLDADFILKNFGRPDVIWASPDCTTYSIAGIRYHRVRNLRTQELDPVSDYAVKCDRVNRHVLELIDELAPELWFVENPVGGLRKMKFMRKRPRFTVCYCQYGAPYRKPTDIWTNHTGPRFKPMCKPGDPCHEPNPRYSAGGLTAVRGKKERAIIPAQLCDHIVKICEEHMEGK